ncbi:MAG: TonB-dependent receptor, partial [Pedobacter sp.]
SRGGWSKIAASSPDAYIRENFTDVGAAPFGGAPTYSNPNTNNDPNIRPELKYTKEIGLELGLFRNRVGLDVTYYDVTSKDLILPVPIDPATGFLFTRINAGEMTNKGIEASLNLVPIKSDNFSWNVGVNFAKNVNKLITLKDNLERYVITNAPFSAQLAADVGSSYGAIIGTDFVYDGNGNKIVDEDGFYKVSALKNLGSILPEYNLGIRSTWKYKSITLSALLDIQQGGKYFSTTNMWGHYSGMLEDTALGGNRDAGVVLDGVKEDGTPNDVNISAVDWGASYYGGVDALNVFDASYVKLRDVTLSYDLPKSIVGTAFQGIRVSAFARNLFAWNLSNKGIDPENTSYGSGNIQGLEGGSLPSTRIYGFNVNFKF